NVLVPIRLRGRLDRTALSAALADVLRRQAALRTTFAMIDGRLVQQVGAIDAVPLPVADLSAAGAELDDAVHELFVREESRPFDLATGPVLRGQLLQLAEDDHVLLLCVHHIAIDAASVPVLYRELAAAYNARTSGGPNELPL